MPARLTADTFSPYQGDAFHVKPDEAGGAASPLTMTLREAVDTTPPGEPGAQFSLLFEGPAEPYLPQSTYILEHPALGRLALFLVPVGRARDGAYHYEAAFNLLPEDA